MPSVLQAPLQPISPIPQVSLEDLLYRVSVEQYHEMIKAGIFGADARVELIDGLLVRKMSKHPAYILVGKLLALALARIVPNDCHVDTQNAVTAETSEPEPDVFVLRGQPRDYESRHPTPAETLLLVEVADSSLRFDQRTKKATYARANIATYWIVNILERRIEVYAEPTGPCEKPTYRDEHHYGIDDHVPVVIDGREIGRIAVRDILP